MKPTEIVQTIVFFIVKPTINWALSNSLNPYNRHSDWHKLEVYGTKMHKLEVYGTKMHKLEVYGTKMSIYLWASL